MWRAEPGCRPQRARIESGCRCSLRRCRCCRLAGDRVSGWHHLARRSPRTGRRCPLQNRAIGDSPRTGSALRRTTTCTGWRAACTRAYSPRYPLRSPVPQPAGCSKKVSSRNKNSSLPGSLANLIYCSLALARSFVRSLRRSFPRSFAKSR